MQQRHLLKLWDLPKLRFTQEDIALIARQCWCLGVEASVHLVDRGGLSGWGRRDLCQVSALALSLCLSCLHLGSRPGTLWDAPFCFSL